jgi:hypothetical protein
VPRGSCSLLGVLLCCFFCCKFEEGDFNTLVMYTTEGEHTRWIFTTVLSSWVRPRVLSSSAEGTEIRPSTERLSLLMAVACHLVVLEWREMGAFWNAAE